MDLDILLSFLNTFYCTYCHDSVVQPAHLNFCVNDKKSKGFAKNIEAICKQCKKSHSFFTSKVNDSVQNNGFSKPFRVNEDMVASSLSVDMGPYKLNKFCESMNFQGIHQKTFLKNARKVYSNTELSKKFMFEKSAAVVRKFYNEKDNDKTPLDIPVSFDGSWLTRGHTSLIGLGSVVEVHTGMVLDMHVISLHCSQCSKHSEMKKTDPAAYKLWFDNHQKTGCQINFKGK